MRPPARRATLRGWSHGLAIGLQVPLTSGSAIGLQVPECAPTYDVKLPRSVPHPRGPDCPLLLASPAIMEFSDDEVAAGPGALVAAVNGELNVGVETSLSGGRGT